MRHLVWLALVACEPTLEQAQKSLVPADALVCGDLQVCNDEQPLFNQPAINCLLEAWARCAPAFGTGITVAADGHRVLETWVVQPRDGSCVLVYLEDDARSDGARVQTAECAGVEAAPLGECPTVVRTGCGEPVPYEG